MNGCKRCMGNADCRPPHWDHPSTFRSCSTRELILVGQPYAPCDDADYMARFTASCEAFARDWHLTVRVSVEESWHYPGKTVLVEYRKEVRP